MIEVYTKDGCFYCIQAKALLEAKGYTYREVKIDRDLTKEAFLSKFPGIRSLPLTVIDDNLVGGFNQLTEWVRDNESKHLLLG